MKAILSSVNHQYHKIKTSFYSILPPKRLYFQFSPSDPWPGDAENGTLMLDYQSAVYDRKPISFSSEMSFEAYHYLHGFEWLRDLKATGDHEGRRLARSLIQTWSQQSKRDDHSDLIARRVTQWIQLFDYFGSSADDGFKTLFFKCLGHQIHLLQKQYFKNPSFLVLKALIMAYVCLPFNSKVLDIYLNKLDDILQSNLEKTRQSPSYLISILQDLIEIQGVLKIGFYSIPPLLQKNIEKIASWVRFFRHGNGIVASFGTKNTPPVNLVDSILSLSDTRSSQSRSSSLWGVERGVVKKHLLLFNAQGEWKSPNDDALPYLNFEWSHGDARLISHGDVVVQYNHDSPRVLAKIQNIIRKTSQGMLYIKGHIEDSELFSLERGLCLSQTDLRGEDILKAHVDGYFAIRFALDPQITVIQQSPELIFKTSKGEAWKCIHKNADEIFVHMNNGAPMLYIATSLKAGETYTIPWAFHRHKLPQ
jgi:uncharacterized heparinase superfamily protein